MSTMEWVSLIRGVLKSQSQSFSLLSILSTKEN